jgi:hypothetical protein
MAVGWISTLKGSGLHDHGGELAFGGDLVADHRLAGELEDVAAGADHLDRHAHDVAGPHRLRKRQLSIDMKKIVLPAVSTSSDLDISTAPVWAMASIISTPGITG